jgi:hypothetical protein
MGRKFKKNSTSEYNHLRNLDINWAICLMLFSLCECAFQMEMSPVINRLTPKMDNRIYSSNIRNHDTRYNLFSHLIPRWESTSGNGIMYVLESNNWFKISGFILHDTMFRGTKLRYSRKSMTL